MAYQNIYQGLNPNTHEYYSYVSSLSKEFNEIRDMQLVSLSLSVCSGTTLAALKCNGFCSNYIWDFGSKFKVEAIVSSNQPKWSLFGWAGPIQVERSSPARHGGKPRRGKRDSKRNPKSFPLHAVPRDGGGGGRRRRRRAQAAVAEQIAQAVQSTSNLLQLMEESSPAQVSSPLHLAIPFSASFPSLPSPAEERRGALGGCTGAGGGEGPASRA